MLHSRFLDLSARCKQSSFHRATSNSRRESRRSSRKKQVPAFQFSETAADTPYHRAMAAQQTRKAGFILPLDETRQQFAIGQSHTVSDEGGRPKVLLSR
jgi:hypothetical protein